MKITQSILITALATYSIAFVLLYLLGFVVATLPVVSQASLSFAFDTVGERLKFATHISFFVLLLVFPFQLWHLKQRENQKRN